MESGNNSNSAIRGRKLAINDKLLDPTLLPSTSMARDGPYQSATLMETEHGLRKIVCFINGVPHFSRAEPVLTAAGEFLIDLEDDQVDANGIDCDDRVSEGAVPAPATNFTSATPPAGSTVAGPSAAPVGPLPVGPLPFHNAAAPPPDGPALALPGPALDPTAHSTSHGNNGRLPYNHELATAVFATAMLPQIQLSAYELLTFFPNHTQWPVVCMRLCGNKWKTSLIAKLAYHARGVTADPKKRQATLRQQFRCAGHELYGEEAMKMTSDNLQPTTNYDAATYAPRKNLAGSLQLKTLLAIAHGVVNWPVGEDAGVFTQVVRHAVNNGLATLTTVDVPAVAVKMGFVMPAEAALPDWDQLAAMRANAMLG